MKLSAMYAIAGVVSLLSFVTFSDEPVPVRSGHTARDAYCSALIEARRAPAQALPATLDQFLARKLAIPSYVPEREAIERRRQVLLGVATLFDGHETLARHMLTRNTFASIARPKEAELRRQVCDRIALDGRNDAGLHFFLSVGLTASLGPFAAERVGRAKEIADAERYDQNPAPWQQGYSFVDLAYDMAGIEYARRILDARRDPATGTWPAPPAIEAFVAPLGDLTLPEEIGWQRFQAEYTGIQHNRFEALVARIRGAVNQAPAPR